MIAAQRIIRIMYGIKMEMLNNVHKRQIVIILFQRKLTLNSIIMNVKKILVWILIISIKIIIMKILFLAYLNVIMYIIIINNKKKVTKCVQINNNAFNLIIINIHLLLMRNYAYNHVKIMYGNKYNKLNNVDILCLVKKMNL